MSGKGDEEEVIAPAQAPAQAPPSGTTARHGPGEKGHTSMFHKVLNIVSTGCIFAMSILFICGSSLSHPKNITVDISYPGGGYEYGGGGIFNDDIGGFYGAGYFDDNFGSFPTIDDFPSNGGDGGGGGGIVLTARYPVAYPDAFFTAGTVFFAAFLSTGLLAKQTLSPVAIGLTALALVGNTLWFVASMMSFLSFGASDSFFALWLSGSILISVYFVFYMIESFSSSQSIIKSLALASASLATLLIGIGAIIVLSDQTRQTLTIELWISGSAFYLVSSLLMAASIFTAK
jgi:hypothetical protein